MKRNCNPQHITDMKDILALFIKYLGVLFKLSILKKLRL